MTTLARLSFPLTLSQREREEGVALSGRIHWKPVTPF